MGRFNLRKMKKVVKAEIISTNTNNGKEYSGAGNFQGNVLVSLTYHDGTVGQQEVDGEHNEEDMQTNYNRAEYWNEGVTYDIFFHDDSSSDNQGFELNFDEAMGYVENKLNERFISYAGGIVQIRCNNDEEVVYEERI